MGALSDPKLEKFAQALLTHLANGVPRSKAAERAGAAAGYKGSSAAANSRKRAQRKDVKARMAELAAPRQGQAEREIAATVEAATAKLVKIGSAELGDDAVKVTDQIAAWKLLAQMNGWMAPEKRDHTVSEVHFSIESAPPHAA